MKNDDSLDAILLALSRHCYFDLSPHDRIHTGQWRCSVRVDSFGKRSSGKGEYKFFGQTPREVAVKALSHVTTGATMVSPKR